MPDIDPQSLADILIASRRAVEYAEGITEDFFSTDLDSQDILIRQMTILGKHSVVSHRNSKQRIMNFLTELLPRCEMRSFTITMGSLFPMCG